MMKDKIKKVLFPNSQKEPVTPNTGKAPDFADFMEQVLNLPDEAYYQYALASDPVYSKMTADIKADLLATAQKCGTSYAQEARRKSKDIFQLMKEEEIDYSNPAMPSGGGYVIFAQYTEPNHITVFQDSLDKFIELVDKTSYKDVFTEEAVKSLLLAHEFFHYIEFRQEKTIVTKQKRMTLWRLLGYHHQTTFISLSEMSAMAFARSYQDFPYSPFVLDCLLTYAYNADMAYAIYQAVRDCAS